MKEKIKLEISALVKAIDRGADLNIWMYGNGYCLNVNKTKFTAEYAYSPWGIANDVATQVKTMETELNSQGIYFKWENKPFECGGRDIWGCKRVDTVLFPTTATKITLCKEFVNLQKWFKKYASFNLSVVDVFKCDLCRKGSYKSLSGYVYLAGDPLESGTAMTRLRNTYKAKNTVAVEVVTREYYENGSYDGSRCDYEQYGDVQQFLKVTMQSPTGRNRKVVNIGMGYC